MKAPVIILANDFPCDNPAVRLSFEKGFAVIGQRLRHKSSQTTEIYPVGNYNLIWQLSTTTDFSNGVNTHVSQKDFAKFKNPFDDNFFDDG